jgi:hypothetical protein
VEPKRASLALECDAPAVIDEVEAIGPAGIRSLYLIIQGIYERRKLDLQSTDAGAGYGDALGYIVRAAKQHLIPDVALHLPDIRRMGLKDVDRVEIDLSLVLLRKLVQGGNLPPEGRSGVAAEDEDHRPVLPKLG